jgi:phosphatidylglycerophosphate synthase
MDNPHKNSGFFQRTSEALESITRDRTRTNLLRKGEQKAIACLVQCVPSWVSSDMLTGFGFFGNLIVFSSFLLAKYININFLFMGLAGFAVSWLGDSLDGRLAYYRNKPRKYYGFTLDITVDWISILLIGCGYIVYIDGVWELFGYVFVVMYGWEMIIALMRYKITGKYSIDAGKIGPTEVRIIIAMVMILEVFLTGSLKYSALVICSAMLLVNITDTGKLLREADERDAETGGDANGSKN